MLHDHLRTLADADFPAPSRPPARTGAGGVSGAHLRAQIMLLQAKALSTAADWAHAYAELAKEKHALAKEKDAQLSVLTKKNRILTQENAVLAKEKHALANALAAKILQCTARGRSTGLSGTPVALVCESLSRRSAHSICVHHCTCDVCSGSGGRSRRRDSAEASSRSRCRARRRGTQRRLSSIKALQARLPRFESHPCNL
jgi:hypothetical protein